MIGDIQHIIVIQSLSKEDKQTGEELYNDLIKRHIEFLQKEGSKMTHLFWNINTTEEFVEMLEYYIHNSEFMNGGILMHFEMHGEEERKGLVLSDGSFIAWESVITKFRNININCCNKLFITMATCYGRFLYQGIFPYKKSPYSGYISATNKVSAGDIEETFYLLFEELIETGNIIAAYEKIEKAQTNFYYKDMEAIFEENFRMSAHELRSSEKFREEAFQEANRKAREIGAPELTKQDEEWVIQQVLADLYAKRKADFTFENCD